jgi:dTDP-4-amino-4,6-dideoxygalactose transaminase
MTLREAVEGAPNGRGRIAPRLRDTDVAVPFIDLKRQHDALEEEFSAAFARTVGASSFILGGEVEEFEREFADYCGAGECIGVGSGTAALALTLMAAGIGAGDEVIVPAHTFIASALGVVHAGATPVFCDVESDTGLIDADAAAAKIGPRTAAIVAVHLYGQGCDMARLAPLAARHGLFLLEDAAQAHGAKVDGARVGSLGDAAAFSFYPSKNLGALGDGGAICTNDPQLATRARELRHLGQRNKGEHVVVGFNERLDGLQAAFLRVKLPYLDAWNAARRSHAAQLRAELPEGLVSLGERSGTPCVYHLFPVRHDARDRFVTLLRDERIQVGLHYTPAVHQHQALAERFTSLRELRLPEAEAWAAQELSLPMFPELSDSERERVARACTRAQHRLEAEAQEGGLRDV